MFNITPIESGAEAPVVALLGEARPEDALKRLNEALSNENPKGIVVLVLSQEGDVDIRTFGQWKRGDIAWAGASLTREAFEE